jgi:hypothetical protein
MLAERLDRCEKEGGGSFDQTFTTKGTKAHEGKAKPNSLRATSFPSCSGLFLGGTSSN